MKRNIDELLGRHQPCTRHQHSQVLQALRKVLPERDSKLWAWHVTIPHEPLDLRARPPVKSAIPPYDVLTCLHCDTEIQIPLTAPRITDKWTMTTRTFYSALSATQCSCRNLLVHTDTEKNIMYIYVDDRSTQPYSLFHGPINLLSSAFITEGPINLIKNNPYVSVQSRYAQHAREEVFVNHINLYKASDYTIALLLPTEDLHGYARAYNIVIYLSDTVIFPTGHEIPYSKLKMNFSFLNKVNISFSDAIKANTLTNTLYTQHLPQALDEMHHKFANYLSKRLKISRSFAPNVPHLSFKYRIQDEFKALLYYREYTILRLPHIKPLPANPLVNLQEFKDRFRYTLPEPLTTLAPLPRKHFYRMKRERLDALQYLLPRVSLNPSVIPFIQYAQEHIRNTTPPPTTPLRFLR